MRPGLFARVIAFEDARRAVLAAAVPVVGSEWVPLTAADGRVAAADVCATADVPTFARAAMDGYAVRAEDLRSASAERPVTLICVGDVFTADVREEPLEAGTCVAIATGAPVPPAADAVVMVEATTRQGATVRFGAPAVARQNVSPRASDLAAGSLVIRQGERVTPARLGSLAASGAIGLQVFRKPRIAILSTGNEVTAPGRALAPGHVYDVNRFTVAAVVERHGGSATALASADDSLDALVATLDAVSDYDAVVFSGGSSVGGRDLLLDAVQRRGRVLFHGIAVKPGKPTLLATVGDTVVFGMPGNPTSCLSNAYMLLVPFLRRAAHLPAWQPLTVTAPLAARVTSAADRHQFYPVRLVDGRVEPAFKSSGDITSLAHADGFIEMPTSVTEHAAGEMVTVTLFE